MVAAGLLAQIPEASSPGTRFPWGLVFVFVFVWTVLPMVVAASLARSRNEPVVTALALTFFLGWIGVAIVAFGQRRTVAQAQQVARSLAPGPGPARAGTRADADPADRLRVIETLYAQGLITDAERERRRAAVVDAL